MGTSVTAGTAPIVQVRDLSVSYRTAHDAEPVHVVHDISFDVRSGECLAVVGESGSGKSTVARTLLAYLRAGSFLRSGSVHVAGDEVFALSGEALRELRGGTVALVAQNAGQALTPSMRVGAQIREAVTVHGGEADERRIAELLDQVALPARVARSYPHELSGGQQQRVAIAAAVAARPEVLVLDEPTTALDVITQAEMLRLLRELSAELNAASVLVSHDLGVVAGMADHVLVMQDGRQVEHAPADRLFAAPAEPYTRMLLASAPRLGDGGLVTVTPDGTRSVRPRPAPRTSPVLVRGEDVTVTYGRGKHAVHAVDGVDLEVHRGEVVALVGQSGSGKSTLAWAVAGLTPPTGGSLTYHEPPKDAEGGEGADAQPTEYDLRAPVRKRPLSLRRRIQVIFQNADTALNPRLSVGTSIKRPLHLFRTVPRERADERVSELLEEVELPASFARRLPAQLSGGQRQRIGIARAMAGAPWVLVADEVTTALDVSVQGSVLTLLDDVRREEDVGCIFISHDLAVVEGIADRVLVMHEARVVEEGPVAAVLGDPRHPYTRELLGATLSPPRPPGEEAAEEVAEHPETPEAWRDADGGWEDHGSGHRSRRWRVAS